MKKKIFNYVKEMRIKSWLKNVFVLFPITFSLELFNMDKLRDVLLLAFAFCLVSSSIYILNDVKDVNKDRKHEIKRNRPIAAGDISIGGACVFMALLALLGLLTGALINRKAAALMGLYIVINIFYSIWLKSQVLIDCFCIAAGFVIRVLVGGTIVTDGVSNWMFLTVVALSLFMAFGKRRGELIRHDGESTRDVLLEYDIHFLDGTVFMCASLTMIFYSLWSISHKSVLVYSVPMVLFIVIRYLLLVFKGQKEADPTDLIFSDTVLLIACAISGVSMLLMLYTF